MKEKIITALMVEPNQRPKVVRLCNTLEALQEAVSIGSEYRGLIELLSLENGVYILCNEEGKLQSLPGNRRVGRDVIAGVFYVVGEDLYGELASLPEEMIQRYMKRFWEPEALTAQDVEHAMFMRFFMV